MNSSDPAVPWLPTVSHALVHDWLVVLRAHCSPEQLHLFLADVGLELASPAIARVTHDQIVRLYQRVAVETGDEMMGPLEPAHPARRSQTPVQFGSDSLALTEELDLHESQRAHIGAARAGDHAGRAPRRSAQRCRPLAERVATNIDPPPQG